MEINTVLPPTSYDDFKFRADESIWKKSYEDEIGNWEGIGDVKSGQINDGRRIWGIREIFTWKEDC